VNEKGLPFVKLVKRVDSGVKGKSQGGGENTGLVRYKLIGEGIW